MSGHLTEYAEGVENNKSLHVLFRIFPLILLLQDILQKQVSVLIKCNNYSLVKFITVILTTSSRFCKEKKKVGELYFRRTEGKKISSSLPVNSLAGH